MRHFNSILDFDDGMDIDEFYPGDLQTYARLKHEIAEDDIFLDWDEESTFDCLSDDE